jgi:hypothetical protein
VQIVLRLSLKLFPSTAEGWQIDERPDARVDLRLAQLFRGPLTLGCAPMLYLFKMKQFS